jgi:inner membrane transporter RhtA
MSVQTGAAIAVRAFSQAGPFGVVWLRTLGAAILLAMLAAVRGTRMRDAQLRTAVAMALVLALTNASFYQAVARLPLGDAVGIEYLGPITVAVLASRQRRDLIWIGLALGGVLAIAQRSGGPLNPAGLVFVALAGTGWAGYTIVGQRIAHSGRRAETLALALTLSTAVLLVPAVVESGTRLLTPGLLGLGLLLGLMGSAFPYTAELLAMGRVSLSTFGVLLSLGPLVAGASGLLFLGQSLSAPELLGFALVCAASAGSTLSGRGVAAA